MAIPHHQRNPDFDTGTMSPIAQRVVAHPQVSYEIDIDAPALVIALKDELLVHPGTDASVLSSYAAPAGSLSQSGGPAGNRSQRSGPADYSSKRGRRADSTPVSEEHDVQVWRLTPTALESGDSVYWARQLRTIVTETVRGKKVELASISPHHVTVVSGLGIVHWDICPAGPPSSVYVEKPSIPPFNGDGDMSVVVIDTGYIPNEVLQDRGGITSEQGWWLDTSQAEPGTLGMWTQAAEDAEPDAGQLLDGVAGHGTFVTGLVAAQCPQAEIKVVGLRNAVLPLSEGEAEAGDPALLFTSEISVAAALANNLDADVVSCGFAFPTLDGFWSLAIWGALGGIDGSRQPAIVAPVGNEDTSAPHWPAAHPYVIGVAATDGDGERSTKADFSNWGDWANCCARGQDVVSTFVTWSGGIWPDLPAEDFDGWARWSGTCFAAPKVTGAIARVAATEGLSPREAYEWILNGGAQTVAISRLTDHAPSTDPFVTLPQLLLG